VSYKWLYKLMMASLFPQPWIIRIDFRYQVVQELPKVLQLTSKAANA
jgi:hypothetical protein